MSAKGRPSGGPQTLDTNFEEIAILWTSEGLSCDGDTVSITASSQPALEDVLLGTITGLPKVHLHNKVLAYDLGGGQGNFMDVFF